MKPSPLLLVLAAFVMTSCRDKGPTAKELRERFKPVGEAAMAALAGAIEAVDAAPKPALDAACEKPGLALLNLSSRDTLRLLSEDEPLPAGDTEIVSYERLRTPLLVTYSPEGKQAWSRLLGDNPLGHDLALMDTGPVVPAAEHFGPSGSLAQSPPGKHWRYEAQSLERVGSVRHLIVLKSADMADDIQERAIAVYLLEYPSAKLVCSFLVSATARKDAKVKVYDQYDRRSGQKVGTVYSDGISRSARRNVVGALTAELEKRFGVQLPQFVHH